VEAFLNSRIAFTAIPEIIASVMDRMPVTVVSDLEAILEIDRQARSMSEQIIVNKNQELGVSET